MLICQRIVICISLFISFSSFANSCKDSELVFSRGEELFNRNQFLLSSIHFSNAAALACIKSNQNKYLYKYSLAMIELNEVTEAEVELSKLSQLVNPKKKSKINLIKNLYLSSNSKLSHYDQKRFDIWSNKNNRKELEEMKLSKLSISQSSSVNNYISSVKKLKLKSPTLAGSLSLIPGLGQSYLGAYQSAAISFVINSLFYMSAKDFEKKGQYNAANAAYLVFSVTYVGNILNSVNMANRINKNKKTPLQRELKDNLFQDLKEL